MAQRAQLLVLASHFSTFSHILYMVIILAIMSNITIQLYDWMVIATIGIALLHNPDTVHNNFH